MIRTVPTSRLWVMRRSSTGFQQHISKLVQQPRRRNLSSSKHGGSSGDTESRHFLSEGMAWYSSKLDTHPITTKCITSGTISATGDISCQYLTMPIQHVTDDTKNSWDLARTGRFSALGTLWVGPVLHYWYGVLFRM